MYEWHPTEPFQVANETAASTSFCKCTCFTNSTIIQLDGTSPTSPGSGESKSDAKKTRGTCSECNKAFCLSYNLPICKGAKEEDVFTTCFKRDSAKDEAVVFIFIAATTGLLVYAAVRPWVEKWTAVCGEDAETMKSRANHKCRVGKKGGITFPSLIRAVLTSHNVKCRAFCKNWKVKR